MLRGSRDFDSAEAYTGFVRKVVERRNRLVQGKLEQERPLLQCLPPAPVPEYVNYQARVRKWSTIQAAGRTYTVPSRRSSGRRCRYACTPSVWKCTTRALGGTMEVKGRPTSITSSASWCANPGPARVPRSTDVSFLQLGLRRPQEVAWRTRHVEYVRMRHLATTERAVDSALALLLEAGEPFDYATVKELANPAPPRAPVLTVRDAGPEGLRLPAGGGGDDGGQRRIGELCHQFRLPTMGAQSVSRFTAAGQAALETLLEVLEQEADVSAASAGCAPHPGCPPARTGRPSSTTVPLALRQQLGELSDGSFVDRGDNVLPSDCPAPADPCTVRLGPPAGGSRTSVLFAPAYRLVQDLLATSATWRYRTITKDNYDFLLLTWGTCPKGPRSPRCSSRSSPNATPGPWAHVQPGLLPVGAHLRQPNGRRRPSTGWSTTRSSWKDVPSYRTGVPSSQSETGGEPARIIDGTGKSS